MSCSTCDQNLVIGETYNLTGKFVCEGCNNNAHLNPNTAIYLGLSGTLVHIFEMTTPQICPDCQSRQRMAYIPCGDRLADILFSNIKQAEPASFS